MSVVAQTDPVAAVRDVTKLFAGRRPSAFGRRGEVAAVSRVTLEVERGKTLGLVGESGSGKSTLGRLFIRLIEPTSGVVEFDGDDITQLERRALRSRRRQMQMVSQNPYDSFDPRSTVGSSVAEPLRTHFDLTAREQTARVNELFTMVQLTSRLADRYPNELSGGQLQRLAVARAVAAEPSFIVLDEPVSALDVSLRAGLLEVLSTLQAELHMALLFIAHDLPVVGQIADRIAVMYRGQIVEEGPTDQVIWTPSDPYTQKLLAATPVPDPVVQRRRRNSKGIPDANERGGASGAQSTPADRAG